MVVDVSFDFDKTVLDLHEFVASTNYGMTVFVSKSLHENRRGKSC